MVPITAKIYTPTRATITTAEVPSPETRERRPVAAANARVPK